MRALPFPVWQPLYHAAAFELNPEKLAVRVAAARLAIHTRLSALPEVPTSTRERAALRDALDVLDIVLEIENKLCANRWTVDFSNRRPAA